MPAFKALPSALCSIHLQPPPARLSSLMPPPQPHHPTDGPPLADLCSLVLTQQLTRGPHWPLALPSTHLRPSSVLSNFQAPAHSTCRPPYGIHAHTHPCSTTSAHGICAPPRAACLDSCLFQLNGPPSPGVTMATRIARISVAKQCGHVTLYITNTGNSGPNCHCYPKIICILGPP